MIYFEFKMNSDIIKLLKRIIISFHQFFQSPFHAHLLQLLFSFFGQTEPQNPLDDNFFFLFVNYHKS